MKLIISCILFCLSATLFSQDRFPETEIINKSSLTVDTLYFGYDSSKIPLEFDTELFEMRYKSWKPLADDKKIVLSFKESEKISGEIHVYYDRSVVKKKFKSTNMPDSVEAITYLGNLKMVKDSVPIKDAYGNIRYQLLEEGGEALASTYYTTMHKMKIADIVVIQDDEKCMDTGNNTLILKTKNGFLRFNNMDNIKFFERDLNHDGKPELYIITYACCKSLLNIFKVE